nr:zinc finger, CCHC-type [Tanacetum cinerariifolium]
MHPGKSQSEHIDEFHKLVGDLAAMDTAILNDDQALLLLTSLPSSYDNFMKTLLYGRDTLKLEAVLATLNSRELQKMTEAKGDDGEGLYVRGISGQRDIEHGTDSMNEDKVSGSRAYEYDIVDVMMDMSAEELLDWIIDLEGSHHMTYKIDYLFNLEEYNDGNVLLGDGRECHIREIDGKTMSIYLVNKSPSSVIGFKTPIDMLKVFGWLASIKQGMLEPVKDEIWVTKGLPDEAKENILGMKIFRDWSSNTLRVSRSRVYNGKLVQTLLEGHSILSLEGSLSEDCDVKKN